MAGSYYAVSEFNTFTLKRGYKGKGPSMEYPGEVVDITINSSGFRGAELLQGKKNVLVIGDSYTFGVYVNDTETYPVRLGELIGRKYDGYQVINAGFASGFDTDQQYVWYRTLGKNFKPSVVVLGFFLGNDILRINTDAWRELDDNKLPKRWINENLQVTVDGYLLDKKRDVGASGVEQIYKIPLLRDSHSFIVIGKLFDRVRTGSLFPKSGYNDLMFAHIFGEYSDDFLSKENIAISLIREMKRITETHGGIFLAVLLPINFMIEPDKLDVIVPGSRFKYLQPIYYQRFTRLLANEGIDVVDVEKAMKESGEGPFFPSNGEVHFNPKGNLFTAKEIFSFLDRGNKLK